MTALMATASNLAATLAQEFSASAQRAPAPSGFNDLFSDGGFMMYPITLCAIAVLALAGRAAWRISVGRSEAGAPVRAGIDGVLFWGVYASVLGVLGTVVGITLAAMAVEAVGEVHVALVSGGIKVALITTIYGLLILLLSALLWFGLRQWHRSEVLAGV
jgi:hypothetical protein